MVASQKDKKVMALLSGGGYAEFYLMCHSMTPLDIAQCIKITSSEFQPTALLKM
jgi:hypothetical protein